jgi:hypothetical protein
MKVLKTNEALCFGATAKKLAAQPIPPNRVRIAPTIDRSGSTDWKTESEVERDTMAE